MSKVCLFPSYFWLLKYVHINATTLIVKQFPKSPNMFYDSQLSINQSPFSILLDFRTSFKFFLGSKRQMGLNSTGEAIKWEMIFTRIYTTGNDAKSERKTLIQF